MQSKTMKQGWEIKKLGECFEYIKNGANIKQERGAGGIPITRIETLSGGVFNRDRLGYADIKSIDKYHSYVMESGDLLLSHINSKSYIGRVVVYVKEGNETIIHGMNLLRLKVIPDLISPFYMYYYSQTHKFKSQIANRRKDAVNQSSISVADLKTIDVPVPPREEQDRIVAELDCLSSVIERKREQLRELDALAQSIFFQMFGDPITNEKGWEVNIIGNLAEFYNGVAHEGSISEDGQYDVINSKFISTQGEIRKHCDSQIFPLIKNDIVMVMSDVPNGKALAKCYLIETSDKYTLNQRICAFRNYNCFKPIFLYYYLNRHPYYLRFDDGNGQTNLRKNDVLNCPVYIPPLALQQEFADKIEAIEKQKELIKKSISEVEDLFNSRMNYYFN